MLKLQQRQTAVPAAASHDEDFIPFEIVEGAIDSGYLILCDHASNFIPAEYGSLGLPAAELERHIAYDIGAEALTRCLARKLGAPAVLSRFSRLLIDPNRGLDDPTLVMRLSDGAVVPGNAGAGPEERQRRIDRFYQPYDMAITRAIAAAVRAGIPPALVSIHSFTPLWRGVARPWEVGILWDADPRLAVPMIEGLRDDGTLTVGDNEPYSGSLRGDTMYRHGTIGGLSHALVEVRQDLIIDEEGVAAWCSRLASILEGLAPTPRLNEIRPNESAAAGRITKEQP